MNFLKSICFLYSIVVFVLLVEQGLAIGKSKIYFSDTGKNVYCMKHHFLDTDIILDHNLT